MLNKIDLPQAELERGRGNRRHHGLDVPDIVSRSAKTGVGVDELLGHLRKPFAAGRIRRRASAGIDHRFWFDNYLGIVSLVRVMQGR